jgi:thiol:disulfide interchange protein
MKMQSSPNKRLRNFAIALVGIVLASLLYLGVRTQANPNSLVAQAAQATPIDVALQNGKPTLMEFYADWCGSCQAMAKDLAEIKQEYGQKVNFSMLNVDNVKWTPEITKYRVDGIPHFVFFDAKGKTIRQAVGEQPRSILTANLDAMISGKSITSGNVSPGEVSVLATARSVENNDNPRAHGN